MASSARCKIYQLCAGCGSQTLRSSEESLSRRENEKDNQITEGLKIHQTLSTQYSENASMSQLAG